MKFIIIFLFLVLIIPFVNGFEFSPGTLTYLAEPDQELCQVVSLESDSESIIISDGWAENVEVEWDVSNFESDASLHNLNIKYPSQLSIDEREVEVCISGSEIGEYNGALVFEQEQEGNSIIKFAVWLKVLIEIIPDVVEVANEPSSGGNNGGGSSGGSGGGRSGSVSLEILENEKEIELVEISADVDSEVVEEENIKKNEIDADSINVRESGNITFVNYIPVAFIILIVMLSVYVNRRKMRGKIE